MFRQAWRLAAIRFVPRRTYATLRPTAANRSTSIDGSAVIGPKDSYLQSESLSVSPPTQEGR
jgi:hypothetical protein